MEAIVVLLVVVGLLAAVAIWLFLTYNRLVLLRNETKNAFAQIDTEFQQRLDLVPALVSAVKGYAKHERETLEAVTQARAAAVSAKSDDDKLVTDGALSTALGRLMLVVEAYPELQANENFMDLQNNLTNLERKINLARRIYNESVKSYNNAQQVFPANLVASSMGHQEADVLKADAEASKPQKFEF
jgi:LemA protein